MDSTSKDIEDFKTSTDESRLIKAKKILSEMDNEVWMRLFQSDTDCAVEIIKVLLGDVSCNKDKINVLKRISCIISEIPTPTTITILALLIKVLKEEISDIREDVELKTAYHSAIIDCARAAIGDHEARACAEMMSIVNEGLLSVRNIMLPQAGLLVCTECGRGKAAAQVVSCFGGPHRHTYCGRCAIDKMRTKGGKITDVADGIVLCLDRCFERVTDGRPVRGLMYLSAVAELVSHEKGGQKLAEQLQSMMEAQTSNPRTLICQLPILVKEQCQKCGRKPTPRKTMCAISDGSSGSDYLHTICSSCLSKYAPKFYKIDNNATIGVRCIVLHCDGVIALEELMELSGEAFMLRKALHKMFPDELDKHEKNMKSGGKSQACANADTIFAEEDHDDYKDDTDDDDSTLRGAHFGAAFVDNSNDITIGAPMLESTRLPDNICADAVRPPKSPYLPDYSIVEKGSPLMWKQLQHLVREMQWTSDDNTVLGLTPLSGTTRCVFAQKNDDGSFLGCVVWNEYDEMAFIGFYIVAPYVRNLGLGSVLWAQAMERIRETGRIIGLRAGSDMAPKFTVEVPYEISRMRKAVLTCAEMREFCGRYPTSSHAVKLSSDLSRKEQRDILRFDSEITGRDRQDLLVESSAFARTSGAVLFDNDGKIVAIAGITSTGFEKDNLFKLAPVYASSLDEVATLIQALLPFCERFSRDARIVVHILTGTVGDKELKEAIGHSQDIELVTLFSSPIDNGLNAAKCYAPHSNSLHYDG